VAQGALDFLWCPVKLHSFLRFLMTQPELYDAISIAFYNLSQVNEMLYDYWLTELYDEEGEIIAEQWNEENLNLMEKDVMNQTLAVDNF
jgi:hypothetical protein